MNVNVVSVIAAALGLIAIIWLFYMYLANTKQVTTTQAKSMSAEHFGGGHGGGGGWHGGGGRGGFRYYGGTGRGYRGGWWYDGGWPYWWPWQTYVDGQDWIDTSSGKVCHSPGSMDDLRYCFPRIKQFTADDPRWQEIKPVGFN